MLEDWVLLSCVKELSMGDTAWQIPEFMALPWHTYYLQLWSQQPALMEGAVQESLKLFFNHAAAEKNTDLSSLLSFLMDA